MSEEENGAVGASEQQGNDTPYESNDGVDYVAELAKAREIAENYKIRAEKAEKARKEPAESTKEAKQSNNGLDYGQKAYLASNGIKGTKEFEFVQQELAKSGTDLDGLLENDYFKSRLETFRNISKTQDAIPTGKRTSGPAVDSAEYWMTKPIEEVPANLRREVVNAKLKQEKSKNVFYNS